MLFTKSSVFSRLTDERTLKKKKKENNIIAFIAREEIFKSNVIFLIYNSYIFLEKSRYGLSFFFKLLRLSAFNKKGFFLDQSVIIHFIMDLLFYANISTFKNYNINLIKYNYNIIPRKNKHFTITRGAMVRKKQSRAQFSYREQYINISRKFTLFSNNDLVVHKRKGLQHQKIVSVLDNFIGKNIRSSDKFSNLFNSCNHDINYFIKLALNIKLKNINYDVSGLVLKRQNTILTFFDSFFFFYNFTKLKKVSKNPHQIFNMSPFLCFKTSMLTTFYLNFLNIKKDSSISNFNRTIRSLDFERRIRRVYVTKSVKHFYRFYLKKLQEAQERKKKLKKKKKKNFVDA